MPFKTLLAALAAVALLASTPAHAHEFIVKPSKTTVKAGEKLDFSVLSAHVFMVSEEIEDAASVKVQALDASGLKDIALTADAKALTYNGSASFSKPGYAMLVGHRLPEVWSKTPEGTMKGGKEKYPNSPEANKYEKFCKTFVAVDRPGEEWKKPVGQKLEIVPVTSPAQYKAGEQAAFQILYDGAPLSTEVLATCDGYTKTPNSYAWHTETDDKGVAQVKFAQKGLWMVRVQHKMPGTDGIKEHVMRSVLVFDVK